MIVFRFLDFGVVWHGLGLSPRRSVQAERKVGTGQVGKGNTLYCYGKPIPRVVYRDAKTRA